MFTAFTTENYPSVAFPAYEQSEWLISYFIVYLYVCIFLFEAVLLGVIIDAYWIVSKEKLKEDRYYVRECLIDAWIELLGEESTEDSEKAEEAITTSHPKLLALFKHIKPHNTEEENLECIQMLDTNEDHLIVNGLTIIHVLVKYDS